ncbi:hypothetical protein C8J57DRAFT_1712557 [Mycena rebaudengoi]|nr:hypothetical protein C8J57DRAFT_1712557 [Mycena rebaudengoi]
MSCLTLSGTSRIGRPERTREILPLQDYLALNAGATTDDRTLADNTMTPEEAQGSTSCVPRPRLAPTVPPSIGTASDSTRLISVRSGACSMEDGPHAAHLAVRPVRNSALPISAGPPPSNSRYVAASRTLDCCLTRCAFFMGVCSPASQQPHGARCAAQNPSSLASFGSHLSFNLGAAYARLSQSATNYLEPIFPAYNRFRVFHRTFHRT